VQFQTFVADSWKSWRAEALTKQSDSTPTNIFPEAWGFAGRDTQKCHDPEGSHSLTGALFLPHIED